MRAYEQADVFIDQATEGRLDEVNQLCRRLLVRINVRVDEGNMAAAKRLFLEAYNVTFRVYARFSPHHLRSAAKALE